MAADCKKRNKTMRHDDRFFDDNDDNDLWDDELELNSDSIAPQPAEDAEPDDYYSASPAPQPAHDDEPDDYYSDSGGETLPEPKTAATTRRERLFGRQAEEEDEGNDYYDSDADPEPEPARKQKVPKLDPEDPDYWISDDEPGIGDIISGTGKKWKWMIAAACALLLLIAGAWLWFFRPYADGAVKYGYIRNMERRGSLIKTFEGSMIPYKELGDPDPFYFQEMPFSVESDSVAAVMKRMMLNCTPVRVEYKLYHSPLPWKGEQSLIIIKADSADPRKILPPEYRINDKR